MRSNKIVIGRIHGSAGKALAVLLSLLFLCVSSFARAEDGLYDPASLVKAFDQVRMSDPLYADYALVEQAVDELDAEDGVIAAYALTSTALPNSDETAQLFVYDDQTQVARTLGLAPQETDLFVSCADDGESGGWMNYVGIFGDIVQAVTGDTGVAEWLCENAADYYDAYTADPASADMDEIYEGNGFLMSIFATADGFSFMIMVMPPDA